MQTAVKLALSMLIILGCSQIGRKWPTLGGLIATMPLTGVIVLLWLYTDEKGDEALLASYVKGALWGILPSILFFVAAYLCLSRGCRLFRMAGRGRGASVVAGVRRGRVDSSG